MDSLQWIPSIATSSLLLVVIWISKNLILTRLRKSVESEFDVKIEVLKADLRNSEEALKAETRSREAEIAVLRTGALSASVTRQAAVDARKLQAVDELWSAVSSLAAGKNICRFMKTIKFDVAITETENNPELRNLFRAMGSGCDASKFDLSGSQKARPYVSNLAWAYFSAYSAIISDGVIRIEMLKRGIPGKDLVDVKGISELVTAALPYYSKFIEEHGPTGYYMLLDELESLLLKDFEIMLSGQEADAATVERAAEILKKADAVRAGNQGVQPIP